MNEIVNCDIKWHLVQQGFLLLALLSWVGGLQQQQLSKGGPQTYQITLTPPPRGAFKQIIHSFLGHHHAQQAGRRSTEMLQLFSFPFLCSTGTRQGEM